jgi:hypothetical protein
MLSDTQVLKRRRVMIARLEDEGCIPKLDSDALYGPARHIKYVNIPRGVGPSVRKPKGLSRRPTTAKRSLG